jgi:3-isopropylmalate/(R)-2-methylmalate dehydratase large subunit
MCTNGNLEDMRAAAEVLKGRKIHSRVRTIIIPGSQQVYLDALREGLIEIFIEANCAVSTPTCGPCLGGHMGVLASGERCVSTSNRNFRGRMGHPESEVYLANPYVAAASAIAGRIVPPSEVMT